MPKLIIANAYELYQSSNVTDSVDTAHLSDITNLSDTAQSGVTNLSKVPELAESDINARYFYNLRFLWLLEPGDAILLPKPPTKGFLHYLAAVKKIDLSSLHIIILNGKHRSLSSSALTDPALLVQLRSIILIPSEWTLQTCYFNLAVAKLADALNIFINPSMRKLAESDFIRCLNSKIEFRKMAQEINIPVPRGDICRTKQDLISSLSQLLKITGQVIVKQEYNASGKGNIGIGWNTNQSFIGVIKTIILQNEQSIEDIVHDLWMLSFHIVEVYYPNQGTFTVQFWTPPPSQEPILINYSEILMESRWVGVQIPPHKLSTQQTDTLISYSKQLATLIQQQGYEGYLCCDAILTHDNQLLFTEVNVRPGAETHAYHLAQHLFGHGYQNKMVVLTHNTVARNSFLHVYQLLNEKSLLLNDRNNKGIVFLTVDDNTDHSKVEFLIAAPDWVSAQFLKSEIAKIL